MNELNDMFVHFTLCGASFSAKRVAANCIRFVHFDGERSKKKKKKLNAIHLSHEMAWGERCTNRNGEKLPQTGEG